MLTGLAGEMEAVGVMGEDKKEGAVAEGAGTKGAGARRGGHRRMMMGPRSPWSAGTAPII